MNCVILCGGLGKRISRYFKDLPKILIMVNKKPFIEYKIDQLKKIKKIILCTGHKGEKINEYFIKKPNAKIIIKKEKILSGTGGSLKRILKHIKSENFFFTYGDNYLVDLPITKMIQSAKKDKKSVMLIYKNNNKYDKSNIKILSNKKLLYDKSPNFNGNYIDYGFFYLNKKHIKKCMVKNIKFDFSVILNALIKKDLITYIIVKKRFYEIGGIDGYKNFERYARSKGL